ncbi:MAG: hypothetical protein MZV63_00295 [Marinilabiliales bacterium]|nr:hypothetical protein [Marinilabiliales bacterium]
MNRSFADIQAMAGYRPGTKDTTLTLSLWGSSNRYSFVPQKPDNHLRTTIENAYRLYRLVRGGRARQV